jgi:hypothetical protein
MWSKEKRAIPARKASLGLPDHRVRPALPVHPALPVLPGRRQTASRFERSRTNVEQVCPVACEANERILSSFAISPGGTFVFEDERRATFRPQRQGISFKVVLSCIPR